MVVLAVLVVFAGSALGGKNGAVIAFAFATIMNFGAYWFFDKIVLYMYGARQATEQESPEFYRIVRDLTIKVNLPFYVEELYRLKRLIFSHPISAFIVIMISFIWLLSSPLSFFVFLFIVATIYLLFNLIKKKENERRLKEFQKKKTELISSGNYKYIENFAKKYKDIEFDFSNYTNLKELIAKKGIMLDNEEIALLIQEETNKQNYEDFKAKMLHDDKPQNLQEYKRRLIEIYGGGYKRYIDVFKYLLNEINIFYKEDQLAHEKFAEIEREMQLINFEKRLNSDQLYSISMDSLDSMTGYEFEDFLKTLFEKMGYKVEPTKYSGDQGADLIIVKFGEKSVIQAKRHKDRVNNKSIQEVVAAIKHYKADTGMVITTSEFTPSAIELAESNNIKLIDRDELEGLLRKYY